MDWTRYERSKVIYCNCGRTRFFQVAARGVAWVRRIVAARGQFRPVHPDADLYHCKACGSYEIVSGPAASLTDPPQAAA